MPFQLRRGTNAERLSTALLTGELIYTTDTKLLYVGDGSTIGGVTVGAVSSSTIGFSAGSGITIGISGNTYTLSTTYKYQYGNTPATTYPSVQRTINSKLDNFVNVKDFGAVGDGVTDDSLAFQNAYNYLRFTVPVGVKSIAPNIPASSGTIYVPRGNYRLDRNFYVGTAQGWTSGYELTGFTGVTCSVHLLSCFNLSIVGDGQYCSLLETGNTTLGSMFYSNIHQFLRFENIGFSGLGLTGPTMKRNAVWLNGVGGGKGFQMKNVTTYGFDKVVLFSTNNANDDTNTFDCCDFREANTVIWARSSQALSNHFKECQFFEIWDKALDIYGFEYTHIDTATIIMPGTFLAIDNGGAGSNLVNPWTGVALPSLDAVSQYILTNCKWEYEPKTNGTSKILGLTGSAYIKLINCGIQGGNPDPNVYQIDISNGNNFFIEIDGGEWGTTDGLDTPKIKRKPVSGKGGANNWGVVIKNCARAPRPQDILTVTGGIAQFSVVPPIIYQNCKNIQNICLKGSHELYGATYTLSGGVFGGMDKNYNSINNSSGFLITGTSPGTTYSFPTYGQNVAIDKLKVVINGVVGGSSNWSGREIKVFGGLTSGSYAQIGPTITAATAYIPGTTSPQIYDITAANNIIVGTTLDVFIGQNLDSRAVLGSIYLETTSI